MISTAGKLIKITVLIRKNAITVKHFFKILANRNLLPKNPRHKAATETALK
jgi:hypothetical protein